MRRWRELYSKRARGQEAKVGYLFLKVAVLLFRKYTFARVIADFRLPIADLDFVLWIYGFFVVAIDDLRMIFSQSKGPRVQTDQNWQLAIGNRQSLERMYIS